MNFKFKLIATQWLFFISIILSIGSFIIKKNGGSEIYPFFYWKLYTQPLGNNLVYQDYRIYGVNNTNDTIRIPNKGYKNFNQDDYYYFLTIEANKVINNEIEIKKHKKRLFEFGNNIAYGFNEYLIIQEKYDVLEYPNNPNKFEKQIISTSK